MVKNIFNEFFENCEKILEKFEPILRILKEFFPGS